MTYPVGPNNQIYYRGEFQDKLKDANLAEKVPSAGVTDTMSGGLVPKTENFIAGVASVALLDLLMNLGLKGGENSLLVKLVKKIESSKWATKRRALKQEIVDNLADKKKAAKWINSGAAKKNKIYRSLQRKAWVQHQVDRFLGTAKDAFRKGTSTKSGLKMPPGHKYLDIEHFKAMKENGKGLEGALKTQRNLVKEHNKVKAYLDIKLKKGVVVKNVALKESTGLSRGISQFFVGVKHFIGNAVGGGGGGKMSFLKKLGGGSLFGYLLNGMFIGSSIQEAKHAPKGERTKVFMEDFMGNWIFGFACWPMISKFVNGLTGLGNTGNMIKGRIANDKTMTKATKDLLSKKAQKYHFLDEIVKTGKYNNSAKITPELKNELDAILANKNPQKAARKAIKAVRKDLYKNLKFKHKMFNKLGRLVSVGRNHTWTNVKNTPGFKKGLETGFDHALKNGWKRGGKVLSFVFKRIPGGLFRMGALVTVLSLPFAYVGKKLSHVLFGKPNLPKEAEANTASNSNHPNYDKAKVDARIYDILNRHEIENSSDANFNRAVQKQVVSRPAPQGPVAHTPVAPQKTKEAKYIPSSAPVIVDNSAIDEDIAKLLDKSGRYEKHASDLLDSM